MKKTKKIKSKAKSLKKKPIKKSSTKTKRKTATKTKKKPLKTQAKKTIKLKKVPKPKSSKTKAVSTITKFNDLEKTNFLQSVDQLLSLHRHEKDGLRSLDGINRILDKYNQHFPGVHEKFEAIVKYGMEKNSALSAHTISIATNSRRPDENDLYELLNSIWDGKTNFKNATDKLQIIYQDAKASKMKKQRS